MEQKSVLNEDIGNLKFKGMLREFERIIKGDPAPEEVEEQLSALKATAAKSADLTARQVEAIADRCKYYMAGEYGNTKRPEHYEQGKPSQKS
jgi:hypothetical protein